MENDIKTMKFNDDQRYRSCNFLDAWSVDDNSLFLSSYSIPLLDL